MKNLLRIIGVPLFIMALSFVPQTNLFAQDPDPFTDTSADVPLDGGLSILLASGVAYVVKKGNDKRKKNAVKDGSKM